MYPKIAVPSQSVDFRSEVVFQIGAIDQFHKALAICAAFSAEVSLYCRHARDDSRQVRTSDKRFVCILDKGGRAF
ncbi:MAG: hypothetical protein H6818_03095 [Phycisphaerales bacterium]|nr:hypothetical protein [Phycisphaerales bacterium]